MNDIIKRAVMICENIESVEEWNGVNKLFGSLRGAGTDNYRWYSVCFPGEPGDAVIMIDLAEKSCYLTSVNFCLGNDQLAEIFCLLDTIQFELKRKNGGV